MLWDKIKTSIGQSDKDSASRQKNSAEALKETIRDKRKSDPLIGPKLAGRALAQFLIAALKNERGVHVEALLCAVGSLAGYSAQASVRELLQTEKAEPDQSGKLEGKLFDATIADFSELLERGGGEPDGKVFAAATSADVRELLASRKREPGQNENPKVKLAIAFGKDGKRYFFGDALNEPLAESRYSVWSLAAGMASSLGCQQSVDVYEIFKHVAGTVGRPEFGVPRIPERHRPADPPSNWIKYVWPKTLATIQLYCESSSEWPVAFGFAIQEVMTQTKDFIDPCLALSIVMECAIPMSKVDATTL